jgi:hypothetical protein
MLGLIRGTTIRTIQTDFYKAINADLHFSDAFH